MNWTATSINFKENTKSVTLETPAKINLALEILGKRPDGYHEIRSVMQKIELFDEVRVDFIGEPAGSAQAGAPAEGPAEEKAYLPETELFIDESEISITAEAAGGEPYESIPADSRNLAYKAAVLFFEKNAESLKKADAAARGKGYYILPLRLRIFIKKRIPQAAGLAGGSADAAAVLLALSCLTEMNAPEEELAEQARELGADVPFMVREENRAEATGTGGDLKQLWAYERYVVTAKAPFGLSAKEVYEEYDRINSGGGSAEKAPDKGSADGSPCGQSAEKAPGEGKNALEGAAFSLRPELREYRDFFQGLCPNSRVRMSGSGPTLFALFKDRAEAERAAEGLKERFPFVCCCKSIGDVYDDDE